MIIVEFTHNASEPEATVHTEDFPSLREADEFMNMVREEGGSIESWHEASESEARNINVARHCPHGY